MRIICVVKFVPNVDSFEYDHEKHVLIRENSRMQINPDDACAIGLALNIKKQHPDTFIEVLSMAPSSVTPLAEDILRVGADKATIISDKQYAGSDTWVTSRILGRYLADTEFDCILTGTQALDGDTSHVPPQLAEILGLNQLSGILSVDDASLPSGTVRVGIEDEYTKSEYELDLPAILSLTRKSGYRLPYVRYKDRHKDVSDRLLLIDNTTLGFSRDETGLTGSLTKVAKAYTKQYRQREKLILESGTEAAEVVVEFLQNKRLM